jgi:hypothetical protein
LHIAQKAQGQHWQQHNTPVPVAAARTANTTPAVAPAVKLAGGSLWSRPSGPPLCAPCVEFALVVPDNDPCDVDVTVAATLVEGDTEMDGETEAVDIVEARADGDVLGEPVDDGDGEGGTELELEGIREGETEGVRLAVVEAEALVVEVTAAVAAIDGLKLML